MSTGIYMSVTFTKLFSSITASTVWCEDPETKIVWITMLAMSDRNGRVWGSIPGIAGIARVSVEGCRIAIGKFLGPDPDSRTKEHEGRRIEPIDGGWRLLNYEKYRSLRDEEERKEYKREWIKNKRAVDKNVDNVDKSRPPYTNAEAEAEAEAIQKKKTTARKPAPIEFEELKASYPKRAGDPGWGKAIKACNARLSEGHSWEDMLSGVRRYANFCRATGKVGTEYVKQASTFFGPDKHFLSDWSAPSNKAEVVRDQNIDVSLKWLEKQNAAQ